MRGARFVRLWLVTTVLAGVVVVMPGRASATITGPCTATLAGVPVAAGHDSAGSAIDVDYRAMVFYNGESTTGEDISQVRVHLEVLGVDVRSFDGHTDGPTWTSSAEVKKYAWAGVGLYRVRGQSIGATGPLCTGLVYMCVKGRSPFTTVAGILGAALAAIALFLLSKGLLVRKRRSRPELAARFGATGVLGAVSVLIVMQQFCVLPLTEPVAGVAVGGSLLGMALVGALIAGASAGKPMPVVVPPKDRQEPEHLYWFEPPDDACNACKRHAEHEPTALRRPRTRTGPISDVAARSSPGLHTRANSWHTSPATGPSTTTGRRDPKGGLRKPRRVQRQRSLGASFVSSLSRGAIREFQAVGGNPDAGAYRSRRSWT